MRLGKQVSNQPSFRCFSLGHFIVMHLCLTHVGQIFGSLVDVVVAQLYPSFMEYECFIFSKYYLYVDAMLGLCFRSALFWGLLCTSAIFYTD
jgi:hypothetical protein